MTPEIRKLFRLAVLKKLIDAGRLGATVNELLLSLRSEGFSDVTREHVREEVEYLIDKGHVAKLDEHISPEVESFKATAAGRDFVAEKSL